jgi:hypothetical protein
MAAISSERMPWWVWVWPGLGWVLLTVTTSAEVSGVLAGAVGAILIAVVFAAVYHAEVVAHRVGEPYGTLVLALAVTVIEVALIVSIMLQGGVDKAGLARDTVFAAVMIICNGLVGLCLLAGGVRHHEQGFQLQGALAALAVLAALTTITLVLPNFVTTIPGPTFSNSQLVFAGTASLVLYGSFVFVQTIRHRDYFLPAEGVADEETHAPPPSDRTALVSLGLLLASLIAVVGLAKALSPTLEAGVEQIGAPKGGRRHSDRGAGAVARGCGGSQGRPRQPTSDQHESGAGLGAREHRADDPGGGGRCHHARPATHARAGTERGGLACPHSVGRRDHGGHRPHNRAARHRTLGDLRNIPVPLHRAVTALT